MCADGKRLSRTSSEENAEILLDVYRTALTSEIMDAKQCEYYTDYAIYGTSDATKAEFDNNVQPNALNAVDQEAVNASELWFYDRVDAGSYIKFRMLPTDDQKQVVTGGDMLYNRLIADDCETSASFIIGVHKTFMGIRAYMVSQKLWDDTVLDDIAFFEKVISNKVVEALTGCTEKSFQGDYTGEKLLFASHQEAYDTVKALANILRQYHLHAELCIGSASAAAIGEVANPSGHCFAMLKATHVQAQHAPMNFILEGTNWIAQKSILGLHGDVQDEIYSQVSEISTIMMEITKKALCPDDIQKDHGKALALVKERCKTAFWRSIYAKGGALMTYKEGDYFIYGVRALDIINSSDDIKAVPLNYNLVCMSLFKKGMRVDPERLKNVIQSVGKAEAVPPWSKKQWKEVIDNFGVCRVHDDDNGYVKLDPDSTIVENQEESVRFVFTHQQFQKADESVYTTACQAIHDSLTTEGGFSSITNEYKRKHEEWIEQQTTKEPTAVQAMALAAINPDFQAAKQSLAALDNFVSVIKTYVCMQSIVTVCTARKIDIKTLHEKLMGWISVMALAYQQRNAYEMMLLVDHRS